MLDVKHTTMDAEALNLSLWFLCYLHKMLLPTFSLFSLNRNCWQGNTYRTVNYLVGVNLSGPHSKNTSIHFIQAEERNRQFGG